MTLDEAHERIRLAQSLLAQRQHSARLCGLLADVLHGRPIRALVDDVRIAEMTDAMAAEQRQRHAEHVAGRRADIRATREALDEARGRGLAARRAAKLRRLGGIT